MTQSEILRWIGAIE